MDGDDLLLPSEKDLLWEEVPANFSVVCSMVTQARIIEDADLLILQEKYKRTCACRETEKFVKEALKTLPQ